MDIPIASYYKGFHLMVNEKEISPTKSTNPHNLTINEPLLSLVLLLITSILGSFANALRRPSLSSVTAIFYPLLNCINLLGSNYEGFFETIPLVGELGFASGRSGILPARKASLPA